MFKTLLFALAIASQAVSQQAPPVFGLSGCGSRCYDMTVRMIGCETTDYACHCSAFDRSFKPQYDSCRIEGCAFETGGISTEELRSSVCAAAELPPPTGTPSPRPTQVITTTATTTNSEASRTPTPSVSTVSSSRGVAPTVPAPGGAPRSAEQGMLGGLALGLLAAAGMVL